MSSLAWVAVLVLTAIVLLAATANYRKHARRARAKSQAAMAALVAETEQIAAQARARNGQSGLMAISRDDPADEPMQAAPQEGDPVRDAYERGYRQGFKDGVASADPPTPA